MARIHARKRDGENGVTQNLAVFCDFEKNISRFSAARETEKSRALRGIPCWCAEGCWLKGSIVRPERPLLRTGERYKELFMGRDARSGRSS